MIDAEYCNHTILREEQCAGQVWPQICKFEHVQIMEQNLKVSLLLSLKVGGHGRHCSHFWKR